MYLTQVPYGSGADACDVIVTEENGTSLIFDASGTGSSCGTVGFTAPPWEQATLSYSTSCYPNPWSGNCWVVTRDGTETFKFAQANGLLIAESTPSGSLSFSYSGTQLQSVTGPSGVRQLSFTWSGGKLSTVTDSASRTVSLGYSSGDLTSITLSASSTGDPTSHEWAFSYNSSDDLTDWWSPNNEAAYAGNTAEATQVGYNTAGEVTSVTEPAWPDQCNGASGTPHCAPETTVTYPSYDFASETGTVEIADANENYDTSATLNDGNGNVTLDHYADGVLMGQTNGYGYETSTTSPYDQYPMSSAVTSSVPDIFTLLPAESLDGDGNLTTESYDVSGNVISSTDALGNTTTTAYNQFNEPLESVDPLGNVMSDSYNSDGEETSSTDPNGNVTTYVYNSSGEQCGMLNADGYAQGDRLSSCPTSFADYVTAYAYDAEGDQKSVTLYDKSGSTDETYVTSDLYNAAGEVCASLTADEAADGGTLSTSCPTGSNTYEAVDTAYDALGNLLTSISPTNAPGGTTSTTYDADGNELTVTQPNGEVTTSEYGPDDELCWSEPLSVSSPSCASPPTGSGTQTTSYSYDADGNQLSTIEPDGNSGSYACLYTTTQTYDNLGNQLSTTSPTGGTTCTNETTSTTSYTYDANGNQLTETNPGGEITTNAYDAAGNLCWSDLATAVETGTCTSAPSTGEVTSYTYNADNNQLTETDPAGSVTTSKYDADGNTCWTDVNTSVATGSCTSPPSTGEVTSYTFDADNNQLTVTNSGTGSSGTDGTTTNTYDEQNRELSTTQPNSDETSYTYDPDGSVLTTTDTTGSGSDTYNAADQLIEETYTDGTPTVSFQYNSDRNRCWMLQGADSTSSCSSPPTPTGSETVTTYSYNPNNPSELTSETTSTSSTSATNTYSYDAEGNLACVSYPNSSGNTCSSRGSGNGIIAYTYNAENELTTLSDWAGDTFTFTYNGNGQECWVSTYAPTTPSCTSVPEQSNAVTTAYSYDSYGNLSDIQTLTGTGPTNLLDLSVGTNRNSDNFITAETPKVNSTTESTDNYTYTDDGTNEVASGPIIGSTGSDTYSYDPSGGMTADTTIFESAAYNTSGELCWTDTSSSSNSCSSVPSGATSYGYNTDGEITSSTPPSGGQPSSYAWDAASGLLVCANTDGTSCSGSGPSITAYSYNGDGLRSSETTNGTTTNFTWGDLNSSPALLADSNWDYVYVPGDPAPFEQIAGTGSSPTVDMLLSDESGNIRGLVQLSSGGSCTGGCKDDLVNYTDYDAYGNPISESGGSAESGGLTQMHTAINANFVGMTAWGFGEGYTDPDGLIYLINRYYNSSIDQFLSIDPNVASTNQAYVYAEDNPTSESDPDGLSGHKDEDKLGLCLHNGYKTYLVCFYQHFRLTKGNHRQNCETVDNYTVRISPTGQGQTKPIKSAFIGIGSGGNFCNGGGTWVQGWTHQWKPIPGHLYVIKGPAWVHNRYNTDKIFCDASTLVVGFVGDTVKLGPIGYMGVPNCVPPSPISS